MASKTIKDARRIFRRGTTIFREGDPSDYFYLITSGHVKRITDAPPERFKDFVKQEEELLPGDYFGTSRS